MAIAPLSADGDSSEHGTVVKVNLGASNVEVILRADESMGDVLGGIPIGIPVAGGVGLSAGDLPSDGSTEVLLGNCTTVVLVGNDLGGATIWHRPKRCLRRRHQHGGL
jgi:hypothetical protein